MESSIKTLDQVITGCQTSASTTLMSCYWSFTSLTAQIYDPEEFWTVKKTLTDNSLTNSPRCIYTTATNYFYHSREKPVTSVKSKCAYIYRAHYAIVWCFSSWYCTAIDDKLFLMGHTRLRDPTTQFMWRVNLAGWTQSYSTAGWKRFFLFMQFLNVQLSCYSWWP